MGEGTRIWDAPLIRIVGHEKLPLGNGGQKPVATTLDRVKRWVVNSCESILHTRRVKNVQRLVKTSNDYLYEVAYSDYDKDVAYEYNRSHGMTLGGCSSVRQGHFFGRNFDWEYNNQVEFLVKTPHTATRYATIGISNGSKDLTTSTMSDVMQGKTFPKYFDVMPWIIVDGMNEYGVVCNINVVPADKEGSYPTVPLVEKRDSLYANMVVRYVLDNFKSAREAVEYLRDYVEILTYQKMESLNYETHYTVADAQNTYIVECVEGEVHIIEGNVMTNFHLHGVTPNADGTVYTNADAPEHKASSNGITEHGAGLERYNIIINTLSSLNGNIDRDGMRELMNSLWYTNAYTGGEWCSEFTGINGVTVDTPADSEAMTAVLEAARVIYGATTRDKGDTWHTVHSTVYDMDALTMHVIPQQGEQEFSFTFDYLSTDVLMQKIAQLRA